VSDLTDEPPPRSAATVERWTTAVRKRITRISRAVTLAFFGIAVGGIVFILIGDISGANPHQEALREDLSLAFVTLLFIGFLPAFAVRRIIGRDVRAGKAIARDGFAYRARVASHERLGFGGMHFLELSWQEDGRTEAARFNIEKLDQDLGTGTEVVVLARPSKRPVAIVLGDALFVGYRRRA
jgi:hypothetical protein